MIKVVFKNGFILDSVSRVREQMNFESKQLELNLIVDQEIDLMTIYSNLVESGSLEVITITDTEEGTEYTLTNYRNLVALERMIDIVNDPSAQYFKVNIKIN